MIHRKLKEQFIIRVNDDDMLAEIIRELSKPEESTAVTSEQLLVWAKRSRSLKSPVSNNDQSKWNKKIWHDKDKKRGTETQSEKPHAHTKMPMKQSFSYCGSSHPPKQCLAYGKKCMEYGKVKHLRKVCRSGRNRAMHDLEQEPHQHHEDHIDMVNINSIIFNSKWSVITANLKALSNHVRIIVPYKVDTCSDGHTMSLDIYKRLFLELQKNNWWQPKIIMPNQKIYNRKTITWLGMCKVKNRTQ